MKDWIRRWGPAAVIMAIIFIASATPGSNLPTLGACELIAKKGGHMLGYGLLAAAYLHGLHHGRSMRRSQFILAACLAIVYAASDEWHQKFTPGRTSSIHDVLIDAIGAGIGLASYSWVRKRFSLGSKF